MSDFVEQLQLAEKAQEDIYFARINRRLIAALRRQVATNRPPSEVVEQHECKVDDALERTEMGSQGS